jgi:hypothetical protein
MNNNQGFYPQFGQFEPKSYEETKHWYEPTSTLFDSVYEKTLHTIEEQKKNIDNYNEKQIEKEYKEWKQLVLQAIEKGVEKGVFEHSIENTKIPNELVIQRGREDPDFIGFKFCGGLHAKPYVSWKRISRAVPA